MKTGYVAFNSNIGKARIFQESFYGEESYLIILKDDKNQLSFHFSLFLLSSGGTGALVVQGKPFVFIYFGVAISLFLLIFTYIFTLARIRRTKKYK